jgi:metal-dependent amidase/aminoacylase/carboxypeptidase family protein
MNKTTLQTELTALRREIHRHPELGGSEHRTTRLLERKLRALGIRTKRITPTGIVGILEGGARTPGSRCVALRGDIDALPVTERGTNRLLGLVSRAHVLAVYEQAVSQR